MKAVRAPAVEYLDVYPVLAVPTVRLSVCGADTLVGARYGGHHRRASVRIGARPRAWSDLVVVAIATVILVVVGAKHEPAPSAGGGSPAAPATAVVGTPVHLTLDPAERRAQMCQDKSDLCPPVARLRRTGKAANVGPRH